MEHHHHSSPMARHLLNQEVTAVDTEPHHLNQATADMEHPQVPLRQAVALLLHQDLQQVTITGIITMDITRLNTALHRHSKEVP